MLEDKNDDTQKKSTQLPYLLNESDLNNFRVSKRSKWSDQFWRFDNDVPGSRDNSCLINWDKKLPDELSLLDIKYKEILHWMRCFIWSMIYEPHDSLPLQPSTIGKFNRPISLLAYWMANNGISVPRDLDRNVLISFIDDIPCVLSKDSDDDQSVKISNGTLRPLLNFLMSIWNQRNILIKFNIKPIPEAPFDGESVGSLVSRMQNTPEGWIKPLPDEVAIEILNKSAWLINFAGNKITKIHSEYLAIKNKENNEEHLDDIKNELSTLITELQDLTTWQAPCCNDEIKIRYLTISLSSALIITIQATSGMRISEICGLPEGINRVTGLPICVRVEKSATGLNEIFILKTVISKTQSTPINVDWMIGMRPNGSNQLPLAVQAIIMLNNIFEPYRKFYPTDRLLISLTTFGNLSFDKNRLGPIHSDRIRRDIKNFVGEWADFSGLNNESKHKIEDNDLIPWKTSNGRIIKTHQFRKTWAQFILATDPRLLPAIQMQFHHLVLAMTESGYIGRNPVQLEALNAVSRQQRNLLIYETAIGKNLLAGKMGDNIEKNISILHEKIKDLPTSEAWKESVKFCDDNDLKIFFSPHGNCMPLRPTQMRCHESANTESRFNIEPNYSTREPSLCAGCSCFIIDSRHINFWEDRYIQNAASYQQAEKLGSADQFRVIKERANQANKLLQKMGVDMTALESKILIRLRDITHG